jgi:glycosyltransferase involved in cell wall biosynthesis
MNDAKSHISVCICTYRRPDWLRRLLLSLQEQQTDGLFSYSIVVADNDAAESARDLVTEISGVSAVPVVYCIEPQKNIALVRNKAVDTATGNWIAFIDDDEFPIKEWLLNLYQACTTQKAQGALGAVRPHFDEMPPAWIKKCGLYDRPEHKTGFVMSWGESRTGNVLFRREILSSTGPAFSPRFPNGGEDQDFFRRMGERGHRFVWCNEAVVYETVPPIRWNKMVMIRRAMLRGRNTLKHARGVTWGKSIVTSIVAVPAYTLLLPFLALVGRHLFMRYLIRLFDHLGRLLAAVGLNRVRERVG